MSDPLDLPSLYDASFNGVDFWQLDAGQQTRTARRTNQPREVVLEHPGGDATIVDLGLNPAVAELRILTSGSNLDSLRGLERSTHTLIYAGGTLSGVYLRVVKDIRRAGAYDAYEATLELRK